MVTPASRRRAASVMVTDFRRSQARSFRLMGLQRSTYRYRSKRAGDGQVREKLRELAHRRPRFGYRRLGIFLRREGYRINHKRLLRLYRLEGLVLPRKRPKKRLWPRPKPLLPAVRPNERWSMDIIQDRLQSGRRLRVLTVVDDYTREWKAAIVDTSIGGVRVVRLLEELRGKPQAYPPSSSLTTGPSSPAGRSWRGPSGGASTCASSTRASRPRTPTSRGSTANSAWSAWTHIGLRPWKMPGRPLRSGGRTTTTSARTARSTTGHPLSLPLRTRRPPPDAQISSISNARRLLRFQPGNSRPTWH